MFPYLRRPAGSSFWWLGGLSCCDCRGVQLPQASSHAQNNTGVGGRGRKEWGDGEQTLSSERGGFQRRLHTPQPGMQIPTLVLAVGPGTTEYFPVHRGAGDSTLWVERL